MDHRTELLAPLSPLHASAAVLLAFSAGLFQRMSRAGGIFWLCSDLFTLERPSPASHPVPFWMFSGTLLEACSQITSWPFLFDCPMCLIRPVSG